MIYDQMFKKSMIIGDIAHKIVSKKLTILNDVIHVVHEQPLIVCYVCLNNIIISWNQSLCIAIISNGWSCYTNYLSM
jgi:hypothetical protein